MNQLFIAATLAMLLSMMTFLTAWMLSMRSLNDREKLSAFECGFDPKNTARIPFSMRFFLLAIIFIVFDIEIVLLVPLPLLMTSSMSWVLVSSTLFVMILMTGLLHEWHEGSLNWS